MVNTPSAARANVLLGAGTRDPVIGDEKPVWEILEPAAVVVKRVAQSFTVPNTDDPGAELDIAKLRCCRAE